MENTISIVEQYNGVPVGEYKIVNGKNAAAEYTEKAPTTRRPPSFSYQYKRLGLGRYCFQNGTEKSQESFSSLPEEEVHRKKNCRQLSQLPTSAPSTPSLLLLPPLTTRFIAALHNASIIAFSLIKEIVLPQGFPQSVTRDYLSYQFWDTIQAFASSLNGSLATLAILKGVGVGVESASALAGALLWIYRDGVGMIARILFSWSKGTSLDSNCKQWRLLADILNDFAFFVDILAPHLPQILFATFACTSSLLRSIVGVAGGGTRMAVIRHQALRDNLAEVAAKDGTQETIVNLGSLLVSMIMLPRVDGNPFLIWTLFLLFTAIHVYSNFRAVRSLNLNTLNQRRFTISVRKFISGKTPSIGECNNEEALFPTLLFPRRNRHFGCRLSSVLGKFPSLLHTIFTSDETGGGDKTTMNHSVKIQTVGGEQEVVICNRKNAWWCIYYSREGSGWIVTDVRVSDDDKFDAVFYMEFYSMINRWPTESELNSFRKVISEQGWKLDSNQLNFDEYNVRTTE